MRIQNLTKCGDFVKFSPFFKLESMDVFLVCRGAANKRLPTFAEKRMLQNIISVAELITFKKETLQLGNWAPPLNSQAASCHLGKQKATISPTLLRMHI